MPICNSPPATVNKKSNTDISADHVTEAAKVKRTREQAYFNSYDFDAIEVLPYEEAGDVDVRRLPVASSLSTQSSTSVPTTATTSNNSSRNSSGRYASKLGLTANSGAAAGGKYAYLQRLGTFFGRGSTQSLATAVMDEVVDYNDSKQMRDNAAAASNGNFLLPRAMLKYHSVGSTNSMSLADISIHNGAVAGASKSMQSGGNNSMKMKAMTNVVSGTSAANVNGGSKTRLSYNATSANNGRDSQTGFLTEAEPVAAAAAAAEIVTTSTATTTIAAPTLAATVSATAAAAAAVMAPRQKKQSTSSSIATTTTSTNDSGVCDERENAPEKMALQTAITTTTIVATPSKIQKPTDNAQHGRASSHQSHYSTDKSGSSGYYSSNVCSTYSLDEHIYCEPVIDIMPDGNEKTSKSIGKVRPQLQLLRQAKAATATATTTTATSTAKKPSTTASAAIKPDTKSNSQREDMHAIGRHTRRQTGIGKKGDVDDDADDDDDDGATIDKVANERRIAVAGSSELHGDHAAGMHAGTHYSDKLRILETSIENLDRHLKNFPSLSTQESVVAFMQSTPQQMPLDISEKLRAYNQLPTIMEGYDTNTQRRRHSWQQDIAADDSLLDIDLDSFLLVNERKHNNTRHKAKAKAGIANPSFLTDEQVEENNYKCAKYINSCPEDAYCVESDNGLSGILDQAAPSADDHYMKRYEDQLHFQNTRELLEDVRDKIRVLTRSRNELRDELQNSGTSAELVPKELEGMIQTLKHELEAYLQRMNQHSELEIRQLCSGLVKNQHVVKMQKAFERRRSTLSLDSIGIGGDYDIGAYEAVHDGMLLTKGALMPLSLQQQVTTTIRCASDPNFKMKRKSITEIFPIADYYVETIEGGGGVGVGVGNNIDNGVRVGSMPNVNHVAQQAEVQITQLQRNLSFHKPVLTRFDSSVGSVAKKSTAINNARKSIGTAGGISSASGSASGTSGGGIGEGDSITEWHRKKPSYWEMYYGTNRMHQALLGKPQRHGGMAISSTQPTMSYPSSRPESDFTLDLPRAEQLRLKMEKEKKFRQRCRYITTFLSLVFFLLTVVVVSLVLTRGKRMFGSMI